MDGAHCSVKRCHGAMGKRLRCCSQKTLFFFFYDSISYYKHGMRKLVAVKPMTLPLIKCPKPEFRVIK
jgi:hypothetical protein